jgi:NitT/TauT family transport system substrate-binding protein
MKKISLVFLFLIISLSAFAQGSKEDNQSDLTPLDLVCGVPIAPPALALLRMIETDAMGDDVNLSYNLWTGAEQLIAMLQGGQADMFAFPLTVASKLYNKGFDVKLTNVNTWGVIYFVTSDPSFKTWEDLRGKTVYIPLRTSPPDYLTQYFMSEAGLEIGKDVKVVYSTQAEIANLLVAGRIEYATMIEPQMTMAMMKNSKLRCVYSFEELWKQEKGEDKHMPNAGFGVRGSFLSENPEIVARFEKEYEIALEWVVSNPKEIGVLAQKELGVSAKVIENALDNMGMYYQSAQDAKEPLRELYELLYSFDPSSIGGKIADSGMLYESEI